MSESRPGNGYQPTREELVESVEMYAKKLAGDTSKKRGVYVDLDRDDLTQIALLAAFEASAEFDPDREANFLTFAKQRMVWEFKHEFTARNTQKRSLPEGTSIIFLDDTSDDSPIRNGTKDPNAQNPEKLALLQETREEVQEALNKLPLNERYLIRRHYTDGIPLVTIANELNCSESTVKRYLANAKRELRNLLININSAQNEIT